jgi:amidase
VAFSPDVAGLPVDPAVRAGLRDAADRLADAGWQIDEVAVPLDGADACFAALRAFMYACDLGRRLDAEQLSRVKATVQLEVREGLAITTAEVADAIAAETVLAQGIARFFEGYDLILAPTAQVLPFPVGTEWVTQVDGVRLERYTDWMRACTRFSVLGVPAISLPSGRDPATGLPLAVQLVAAAGQDLYLLQAAKTAETTLGRLGPPPLLGTTSRGPLQSGAA